MNLTNQFLIALPSMQDPRFRQSVILICEHNEDGAMGVVINKTTELQTNEVFDNLALPNPNISQTVLDGGPLSTNCGFIIHQSDQKYKSSVRVSDNLTLTTSKDLLLEISSNKINHKWQFMLGFAGWEKDQLENEIAENSWLTHPSDSSIIFDIAIEDRWQKSLELIGVFDYKNITGVGHA